MNAIIKHIATTLFAAGIVYSQPFDLMNVNPSDKVASSAHFAVTFRGIEQFTTASLTSPFSVNTGDTLVVGGSANTTSVTAGGIMPTQTSLNQNYPNPFNGSTVIRYAIEKTSDVTIKIYDMTGKEVSTLVNETKTSGLFSVGFSNKNIASGTYFYRLIARSPEGKTTVETKKMIVLK